MFSVCLKFFMLALFVSWGWGYTMSEELQQLRKRLEKYEATRIPIKDHDRPALTGDVVRDAESIAEHMSRSRTKSEQHRKRSAIIVSSKKITTSQIPEFHRDTIIGSLNYRKDTDSDQAIEVVEHRAIVSGYSSFIDPNNVIKDLCPVIYEIYVEDQETNLMAEDRVVEVIMMGDHFGIIESVPSSELDYEDPTPGPKKHKKGDPKEKSKEKFKSAKKEGVVKPLKSKNDSKQYSKDKADGTFPEVNGQQFMLPIQPHDESRRKEYNTNSHGSDFWQKRGAGVHGGVDLYGKNIGTGGNFRADPSIYGQPVVAVADGDLRITQAGKSWDNNMAKFAAILRKKHASGQLLKDIANRYGQAFANRCKKNLKRPIPNTWEELQKWGLGFPPKRGSLMDKLVGMYNNQGGFVWAHGGKEAYLFTDKDQKGNRFFIIYSHLSKHASFDPSRKIKKDGLVYYRVKRGEVIGYVGHTALFVRNNTHLHFVVRAHPWVTPSKSFKNLADFKFVVNGRTRYYYVPARVIPGMVGAKNALYSK